MFCVAFPLDAELIGEEHSGSCHSTRQSGPPGDGSVGAWVPAFSKPFTFQHTLLKGQLTVLFTERKIKDVSVGQRCIKNNNNSKNLPRCLLSVTLCSSHTRTLRFVSEKGRDASMPTLRTISKNV